MLSKFYDVRTLLQRTVKDTPELKDSSLGLEDYYLLWKGFTRAVLGALH